MDAKTPLAEYASLATNELLQLTFVCWQIATDLGYDESVMQAHNKQWPGISPVTNEPFNSAASRFLGTFQLCRAVDIYNWYCREALRLALSVNPQPIIAILRKSTGRVAKTVAEADRKGKDAATEVVREFLTDKYTGERTVRRVVHRDLDVMQNPEVELLCTCRNVLVHQQWNDGRGSIAKGLQKLGSERALIGASWYPAGYRPIALDKTRNLIIDASIRNRAAEFMHQQIFMMDQNFAHVYKLRRKTWDRPSIGRKFLGPPTFRPTNTNRTGPP
jgi:hypothetical protein